MGTRAIVVAVALSLSWPLPWEAGPGSGACVVEADERPDASTHASAGAGRDPRPAATERPDRRTAETIAQLADDLRADRPESRRSAVRKLAALPTRDAYALVLSALADPEGMVADEAQMAAGATRDPRFAADLERCAALPSTDEWVRLRAAEALGRVATPIEAKALVRCVGQGPSELARTAAWSIERLAAAKRLTDEPAELAKKLAALASRGNDAEVRGAALHALRPVDAFRAHDLALELLSERDVALRCAALGVVASFSEQECLTVSSRALGDEAAAVRAAAIENLARQKSRSAVTALIAHLEVEERSRLRYEILRHLRTLSGEDHGFDLAAWRAWASTLQGPWSTGGTRPATGPLGDTRVALAGLTLLSDRVTFLIDLSGSMWDTKRGARTRKTIVDDKLRACLEALPKTARFNVIPYTRAAIPWEKQLAPATKENVARAAEWFERCHQRGPGNLFDAARLALLDPEVDTLVMLTDGVPTGGRRWHLELMVELLVEVNRFRRVAFDSILVDAPRKNVSVFADLAARTGGRSIVVNAYEDLDDAPVGPAGPRPPAAGSSSRPRSSAAEFDGPPSVPAPWGPDGGVSGLTRDVPESASPPVVRRVECRLLRRPPHAHDAVPLPVLLAPARAGRGPRSRRAGPGSSHRGRPRPRRRPSQGRGPGGHG